MESVEARIVYEERLELGEGPTYDPASDTAYWFDIVGRALFAMPATGGAVTRHDLPLMASEIAMVDEATQILATEEGLFLRDAASGRLTPHVAIEADDSATRSNDGGVHPSGALWIGTMGKGGEPGAGAIYHYRAGRVERLYANVSIPNAICFSSDGRTAYFTDTAVNRLMRVACDPDDGRPTGQPEILSDYRGRLGALDGASVAADGTIWVACWGGKCITVFSPEGEIVRQIRVPASQPSCPAFIGRGGDRLLVTTAHQGMTPDQVSGEPNAGKTFLLDPGTRGRMPPRVVIG